MAHMREKCKSETLSEALSLASRYLREAAGLSLQQVVEGIERQADVKISRQALHEFETGSPSIGQEKIDALITFHGCVTPKEMVEKGNAAALHRQNIDKDSLRLAARYLRKEKGLTQPQTIVEIEQNVGVKISLGALQRFETGRANLRTKRLNALIAFHGCKTAQEMVEKGNAAALHRKNFDKESLSLATRYLREAADLTLQQVVDGIERQSDVKISPQDLYNFETGAPTLGQEKIDALIAFHGCTTPQEMIEKANHAAAYLFRDESGKLKSTPPGQAVAHTLRQILDRPFHHMEKLAVERNAQENPNERSRYSRFAHFEMRFRELAQKQ